MSTSFAILSLKTKAGQKIFQTQSCLFSNQIEQLPPTLMGDEKCTFAAVGAQRLPALYSREQLMAVRFLPKNWRVAFTGDTLPRITLHAKILAELQALRAQKSTFLRHSSDAFRWVHGDADGLPGIVIDDYGPIVVVQSGSHFGDFLLPVLIDALLEATEKPLFERSSGQVRAMEKLPERTRWIREPRTHQNQNLETVTSQLAGMPLSFRPARCQKTGLFIDQRENLELFKSFMHPGQASSMLDLCSYVGAWSCAGAGLGVNDFTLVDQDKTALDNAEKNIQMNLPAGQKHVVNALHGDLFEVLSKLVKEKKSFDAVVADPPAFTKSAKHVPEAKRAYQRLTKLASKLVATGGLYVACSCSRHIGEEDFYALVSSALAADDWIYLGRGRQSPDHTVLATDRQSLYLKVLFFARRGTLTQISTHNDHSGESH